jgi:hypothetical protein
MTCPSLVVVILGDGCSGISDSSIGPVEDSSGNSCGRTEGEVCAEASPATELSSGEAVVSVAAPLGVTPIDALVVVVSSGAVPAPTSSGEEQEAIKPRHTMIPPKIPLERTFPPLSRGPTAARAVVASPDGLVG